MNHIIKPPVILCFADYYLPGYRSGGPVRSISNFVDYFGDEYDIHIITRDRDFLDSDSYLGICIDRWNRVGKANVFYASNRFLSLWGIAGLLRNTTHDILYLNSFFSYRFTALPLLARKLGLTPKIPCVLAPRGELASGALLIKAQKKTFYLALVKVMRLCNQLHWQASSEYEAADISRVMGISVSSIAVASDLPAYSCNSIDISLASKTVDDLPSPLRLISLSRITPIKNLEFLLESLCFAHEYIELAIYGPLEDHVYWSRCQRLISVLPLNVSVEYFGEVIPSQVMETFSAFELFAFPTFGENYGHVVFECLISGTPVLISDQTPWNSSADGAVSILPLTDPLYWAAAIDRHARLSVDERLELKSLASNYARDYLKECNVVQKTRHLFSSLLIQSSRLSES